MKSRGITLRQIAYGIVLVLMVLAIDSYIDIVSTVIVAAIFYALLFKGEG